VNVLTFKIICKSRCTFGRYLRKTKPIKEAQVRSQCVYKVRCECGRVCIGEKTGRPLTVRLKEHRGNLKEVYLGKSELAQPALEEVIKLVGHKLRFYNLSLILCIGNTRNLLVCYVQIIL
jgi:hypothetical protein